MASIKVIIPIIMSIISIINPGVDAQSCGSVGAPALTTFANKWWVVAFTTENPNATIVCGRYDFYEDSGVSETHFTGNYSAAAGSTTVRQADLDGELTTSGADIRGFLLLPEWVLSIIMCDSNQAMIWRRATMPGNLLFSRTLTVSSTVLAEFTSISADDGLLTVKNADNSNCNQ